MKTKGKFHPGSETEASPLPSSGNKFSEFAHLYVQSAGINFINKATSKTRNNATANETDTTKRFRCPFSRCENNGRVARKFQAETTLRRRAQSHQTKNDVARIQLSLKRETERERGREKRKIFSHKFRLTGVNFETGGHSKSWLFRIERNEGAEEGRRTELTYSFDEIMK